MSTTLPRQQCAATILGGPTTVGLLSSSMGNVIGDAASARVADGAAGRRDPRGLPDHADRRVK